MRCLDAVGLTQELVRFETVNPPGDERACAHHLGAILDAAGFAVAYHEFAERRTSIVAHRGGAGARLCFTGHIDTVPLGAQAWSVDPFAGTVRDGKLFGRGTSDMKSGVAAFVAAAVNDAATLDDGPGVVLVITAGEETGCEGAFHLAGLGDVLGEAGAIVVAEPTSNRPLVGHKGALWLKARTRGVTAHGSMPERGDNAVYKAARLVSKLEDFDFNVAPHPMLGKATLNVGTIAGGMNINSVPDRTEAGIDIRTIPGMDHQALRENLGRYLAPELDALDTLVDLDGVWTEPGEPWMQEVFRVAGSVLGEGADIGAATYFTDASALTPAYGGAPTVILGPGEAAMAHQTDEYCHVDRIPEAVEIYAEIIRRWRARARPDPAR